MLDIEKLRLTKEETPYIADESDADYVVHQAIADAQLAKAVWGIVGWHKSRAGWVLEPGLADELREILTKAGIKEPNTAP